MFGAQGITVHPRPDQRHIRYDDIPALKQVVRSEFNMEGNPTPDFMQLVLRYRPDQCTLVPDDPGQLTSNAGWDTVAHRSMLSGIIDELHASGIRVSVFTDPDPRMVAGASEVGADRVELYTGPYAEGFQADRSRAIAPYVEAAKEAERLGIGLNAGHDLNLENLKYFSDKCPNLLEVSIGHALISDALYYGLSNTIRMYLRQLS
jgi:pyridoxine 5-phosphate synthase